jgi:hypothetical protein
MQKEIGGGSYKQNQSPIIMIFSGHACRHPVEKPTKSIPPKDFQGKGERFHQMYQNVPKRAWGGSNKGKDKKK